MFSNQQPKTSEIPSTSNNKFANETVRTKTTTTNTKSSLRSNTQNSDANNQNKHEKIPPINIYNVEPNEIIKFIKNGLKIDDFKIKEQNRKNGKIILYLNNIANFARVKTYLQKTKTNF